jgi:hypothetical protein
LPLLPGRSNNHRRLRFTCYADKNQTMLLMMLAVISNDCQ